MAEGMGFPNVVKFCRQVAQILEFQPSPRRYFPRVVPTCSILPLIVWHYGCVCV